AWSSNPLVLLSKPVGASAALDPALPAWGGAGACAGGLASSPLDTAATSATLQTPTAAQTNVPADPGRTRRTEAKLITVAPPQLEFPRFRDDSEATPSPANGPRAGILADGTTTRNARARRGRSKRAPAGAVELRLAGGAPRGTRYRVKATGNPF